MAITRATAGVLLAAFLATASAIAVATNLTRLSAAREMAAPEGWAALERQDAAQAAAIFARELKNRPQEPTLHFGAGSAAYALGRPRAALASLQKAVDLDPQFAEAFVMLGRVAYAQGQGPQAIRSLEQAAALRPRDREIRSLLDRWRHESSVHGSYLEKPSGHFRILYEGGTQQHIGDRVARVLEREYVRIGKALDSAPAEPVTVILYTDRAFQDITRSPSWATGRYDGRIRVAVGGTIPGDELDRVVTHELVHAVVANAAPRRVPAWLNEGLATHLEGSSPAWVDYVLRNASTVVPLERLEHGFTGMDEDGALLAYAESATAAAILCERLGGNIGAFLKEVGNGRTVDQALLEFQVQPDSFHAEWRRRVGLQ
jgi:tetratricopeptide (TPR) repeat protein